MPSHRSSYVRRVCKHCGQTFQSRRTDVERGQGNFCSHSCCAKASAKPPMRYFLGLVAEPNEYGCMLWTGSLHNGYGLMQCKKQPGRSRRGVLAHRYIFEITYGPLRPDERVLHDCDQFYPRGDSTSKRCVNPLHLKLGTQAENMADMVAKDRQMRGEGCNLHKLTEDEVLKIRRWYGEGLFNQSQLAKFFHVSIGNISAIVNRQSWKHL